jgi:hypothetical protein
MPRDDEHYSDRPPDDRRERGDRWEGDERWESDDRGPRRDRDYDEPRIRRSELGWLDRQFLDTNMVLLVIFSLCCGVIALTFGVIGVCTCQHPDAKQKALVVTIISGIMVVLGVVGNFARLATLAK